MKKSTIYAFIALIVVFSIVSIINNKVELPEKTVNYTNVDELINDYINSVDKIHEAQTNSTTFNIKELKALNTPLNNMVSKRYRLSLVDSFGSPKQSNQIPHNIIDYKVKEVLPKDLPTLEEHYDFSLTAIPNYEKAKEVIFKVVVFEYGKAKYTNVVEPADAPIICAFVIVDEGEGYVIDDVYGQEVLSGDYYD